MICIIIIIIIIIMLIITPASAPRGGVLERLTTSKPVFRCSVRAQLRCFNAIVNIAAGCRVGTAPIGTLRPSCSTLLEAFETKGQSF